MGTSLIDNFDYRGRRFLDGRQSVATLAALRAVPETSVPDGFRAYCAEDGQWYEYNSGNAVDATTGKWRRITTEVAQTTGDRADIPMSQKAVTDLFSSGIQDKIKEITGGAYKDGDYPKTIPTRSDNSQIGYVSRYTGTIKRIRVNIKQLRGDANDGIHINDDVVVPGSEIVVDKDLELEVNIPIKKGDIIWAYHLNGVVGQSSDNCILKSSMSYFTDRTYALSWDVETTPAYVSREELGDLNGIPGQPKTIAEAFANINSGINGEINKMVESVNDMRTEIDSFDGIYYDEGYYTDSLREYQSQRAGYKVKHGGYLKRIKFSVSTPTPLYVNDVEIIKASEIVAGENEFSFDKDEIFVNVGDCINIGSVYFDRTAVESYIWQFKEESTRRFAMAFTIRSKSKYASTEKFERFSQSAEGKIGELRKGLNDLSSAVSFSTGYSKSVVGELPEYLKMYKVTLFNDFTKFTGKPSLDNPQGFDIYDSRYLFQGSYKAGTGGSIIVVDLDAGIKLGKVEGIGVEHVNLIICGDKYDESDLYPTLWVSSVGNEPYDGMVIRLNNDLNGFEVVHNIKYIGTQLDAGAHVIPFKEDDKIILYSFGIGSGSYVGKALFVDAAVLGQTDVTIDDIDIERHITFQAAPKMQGARVLGGQLCVPTGIGDSAAILFVNIDDGSIESKIPLAGELYPFNESEPEAVALYKNCLIVTGKDKAEYRKIQFAVGGSIG